ncbi:bifunctional oligoribonuclease/PAP phosphatase NrnA [candidate division KSB1 bacterium]
MNDFKNEIISIIEAIKKYQTFAITSHINPDGDGLGSEIALYHLLKFYNKDPRIINDAELPDGYRFMDPEGKYFNSYSETEKKYLLNCDAVFVMDISEIHRLGIVGEIIEKSSAFRICIDHHTSNNFPADIMLIDENAVSTGELLLKLIKRSGMPISKEIANALYISIMTDTGCFKFSNTNSTAHSLGAELLELGASHQELHYHLYETDSWPKTRLFANALSTLDHSEDGKIAWMQITKDMLIKSDADYSDIEGFAEFSRNIKGVLISLLFVEHPDNKIKLSIRSNNSVETHTLAKKFGGGGHKNASAAVIEDISIEKAMETVINAAIQFINNM